MEPITISVNHGMDEIIVTPTPGNDTVLDLYVSDVNGEAEVSITEGERQALIRALGGIYTDTWAPGSES